MCFDFYFHHFELFCIAKFLLQIYKITLKTRGTIWQYEQTVNQKVHARVVHRPLSKLARVISGMTSSVDLSARSPWNSR
jgi:hypothetical protein